MPLKLKGMPPTAEIKDEPTRRAIQALVSVFEKEIDKANKGSKNSIFSGGARAFNKRLDNSFEKKTSPNETPTESVTGIESIELESGSQISIRDVSEQLKKKFVISWVDNTDDGGGSSGINMAIITGYTDAYTYTADIYSNPDDSPIESGVTFKVNSDMIDENERVPDGTMLPCYMQNHGSGNNSAYYTAIEVSRWL